MSDQPSYKTYMHPAGGWGALGATAKILREQSVIARGTTTLLAMNKPDGFKCSSCAWPTPDRVKTFEFCENGAKALAVETTRKRVTREFFASTTVSEMALQSDYWLEEQGRLTEPMRYDAATDHYVPCSWDAAFADIGAELRALDNPDQAEFYTSGRTSNEAAFLYSVFIREFGTNNFPDCSNMCHEPTSRGLPHSIGIGKGTVVISDFARAEAIFIIGQNPGTNSPRMMTELVAARHRNVPIVAINPMPEQALIKFTEPQNAVQMATFGSTAIASEFCHVRIGGDMAVLKGIMKVLLETPDALDQGFIEQHTQGFEALAADIEATGWSEIEAVSGLGQAQIRRVAAIYARSKATIICFGMGITQHQQGSRAVQQIANLLLLKGNFGKPGAGICPVRGHSNVQGDRTVGIDEKPTAEYLDNLKAKYGFEPPRDHGHHVVDTVRAMIAGTAKVFIGMGGNFIHAIPDTPIAYEAMSRLRMTVAVTTKLNRGHVIHGRKAYILPCIARSEYDVQKTGRQSISIEDAMSNVMASKGILEPAGPDLLSEIDIVCRMARATIPRSVVPWEQYVADYSLIRDAIAEVYPKLFANYNERLKQPHGFHLYNGARERVWRTPSGRANFLVFEGVAMNNPITEPGMMRLATVRSHDQFNTTIYSYNDRYRGVRNDRMVVFMSEGDMRERGLSPMSKVRVETITGDGIVRSVGNLTLLTYPLPSGSIAAYYPELNPLLPLEHFDQLSGTPAAKSIPVRVVADTGPDRAGFERTGTQTGAAQVA
ncbi:FdhF/YdeP family oxidoreductase [Lichenicoccus roseus]|uniref:FdhF/YdeP family oxidoreductase n=1 Tax=Lichenicoccus roseus TaxID=2683649 RepID=A0A5R9J887_9PROT|nr:FdhF/YdeP family oxidoreductase [Lichenicoccus roseus]TLU73189.1 FdhF/YdeP family oxidoreductase [Lichenicoccus roseus]